MSVALSFGSTDAVRGDAGIGGCYHCGLPVAGSKSFPEIVAGISRTFCCPACRTVCLAIYEAGLEGYYQRGRGSHPLSPPPTISKEIGLYDLDEVQGKFVDELGPQRDINLLIDGIHCPACVWLIERALEPVPGVLAATVNLSGKRLRVRWDNAKVSLSRIIQRLGEIGYAAVPFDPEVAEGRLTRQNRNLLYRIAFAGFAAMNLMWTSIALYSGADKGEFRDLFYWVGFALATPTLFYSGFPFLQGAWHGLKRFYPTMDLPIVLGAAAVYVSSTYSAFTHAAWGGVYFDTVVNFIFVILVGRFLESASRRKAVASTQRLFDLQPRGAMVIRAGEEVALPIHAVQIGESVLVRPGARIPVDGTVLEGCSEVDEAMLTGESKPVLKKMGDAVCAGSMNLAGAMLVRATGTLGNSALGRIIRLVEQAQSAKAPVQRLADRIVPWFVGATIFLAGITFGWWLSAGFTVALMAATAVLVITCPCALGLATPMAMAVASGLGARHGILVKNGAVLETLSHVTHMVFDKTGTLTEGRMRVHKVLTVPDVQERDLLMKAAAVERMSEHHIGLAIVDEANLRGIDYARQRIDEFRYIAGHGVSAHVDGAIVLLGSSRWLESNGVILRPDFQVAAAGLQEQAVTCVHVAVNGRELGMIGVMDRLRGDAKDLIKNLRLDGIKLTMLSGDRRKVAEAVATQLGGMEVIAEVLPGGKDRVIMELQRQGEVVAMIGDGINDAAALARADVGIAIGSGADVSAASADLVLISDRLDRVRQAMQLARNTLRTVKQNIGISVVYNAIMVPLAMAALITPLVAAIAMPISSLLVVANAIRINNIFGTRPGPAKSNGAVLSREGGLLWK